MMKIWKQLKTEKSMKSQTRLERGTRNWNESRCSTNQIIYFKSINYISRVIFLIKINKEIRIKQIR